MFEQPADWDRLSSSERREARFAAWMSTAGKEFATDAARATYTERVQRVKDIVDLKTPDRVPLLPFIGGYFANYAGITPYEVMYDYDKYAMAWKKFTLDFAMDYNQFSGAFNPGKVLDILDYKVYQWPGHGIPPTVGFQALEEEYMREDEYDLFIADPEDYYMKVYVPRAFGALTGFGMLPTFFATMELPFIPAMMIPAGIPPVQASLKAFMEAGLASTPRRRARSTPNCRASTACRSCPAASPRRPSTGSATPCAARGGSCSTSSVSPRKCWPRSRPWCRSPSR
jgi:hypothetical protein